MIKAICDYCGKDLGRVMLERVQIKDPPRDDGDISVRQSIPYFRSFKLRRTEDEEQNHIVACNRACAEMLDGGIPRQGIELDPSKPIISPSLPDHGAE